MQRWVGIYFWIGRMQSSSPTVPLWSLTFHHGRSCHPSHFCQDWGMDLVEASWVDHYFADMARHGQTRIQRFVLVRIEMGLKFWGQTVWVPQPLILFWGFTLLLKSYLLMNKTWLLQLSFIFGSKTTSLGRVISHFDSLRRPSMQYVYLFTSTCIIAKIYCIIT
jgi:hypothetical protein